ncbi:MAG: hypothetical protein GWP05_02760 [Anaerolineaceae bacterium]|nr:hypothetical protein [Anaerolineaceae bacterium]
MAELRRRQSPCRLCPRECLADRISPRTFVNVMRQYRPCFRASDFPEIDCPPEADEILELKARARRLGLRLAE